MSSVLVQEGVDRVLQLFNTAMGAALDLALRQQGEEPLDLLEP